jgi:hypothetical protein
LFGPVTPFQIVQSGAHFLLKACQGSLIAIFNLTFEAGKTLDDAGLAVFTYKVRDFGEGRP